MAKVVITNDEQEMLHCYMTILTHTIFDRKSIKKHLALWKMNHMIYAHLKGNLSTSLQNWYMKSFPQETPEEDMNICRVFLLHLACIQIIINKSQDGFCNSSHSIFRSLRRWCNLLVILDLLRMILLNFLYYTSIWKVTHKRHENWISTFYFICLQRHGTLNTLYCKKF